MTLTTTRRLVLVGALLLTVSCTAVDDLTDLDEDAVPAPASAPTEATTNPQPSPTVALPHETATVVGIVDGDTFDVRFTNGRTERIRPPQFDAPEHGECWHGEATAMLEELIGGRAVRLVPLSDGPDRDPHGRLLRKAEADGRDVGALMLEAGAARWLDGYANEDANLAAMYEAAEGRGRQAAQAPGAPAPTGCDVAPVRRTAARRDKLLVDTEENSVRAGRRPQCRSPLAAMVQGGKARQGRVGPPCPCPAAT